MTVEHAASPLRMLYQGIAAASAVGLLLGAAMKPQLREMVGPEGPQMLAGVSGKRVYRDGYEAGWTSWSGPPPDYVIGTDWLRPPAYPEDTAYVVEPDAYDYEDEEPPQETYAPPAPPPYELADLEPPPRPRMPSLDGDVLAGVGVPPPPPPPLQYADLPPDA